MWYVLTKYSFDADKTIAGPFETEDQAWSNAEKNADEEYRIDTEECGWITEMEKSRDAGEIVITNYFDECRSDVTEFIVFELDNTKLM